MDKRRPGVGVGCIVIHNDCVLMLQRRGSHGAGTYSVPGGHMEWGDFPEETAEQKTLQETGVRVRVIRQLRWTNDIMPRDDKHYVTVFVEAEYIDGEPEIREPDKCVGVRWVPLGGGARGRELFLPLRHYILQHAAEELPELLALTGTTDLYRDVAVGSRNPVKVESAKQAFHRVWPGQPWRVWGYDVASGVPEQPMNETEAVQGAGNRARAALEANCRAEYGVGMEGGLVYSAGRWMECGWIVVVDRHGNEGIGATATMDLPGRFVEELQSGQDLGAICDRAFGTSGVGQDQGYFGLMTNGAVTRMQAYREATAFALARFAHPRVFARPAAWQPASTR